MHFMTGKYPISQLVLKSVKSKINYPGSLKLMQRLLKNLKFSYKKCSNNRKFLMERNNIASLQCTFLRSMCTMCKNKATQPMIYLDETWVNQNHSLSIVWQNEP